jgi:hypothetical protein
LGFKVEINSILRSDAYAELEVGHDYTFEKVGSRLFFDDIPIWLTRTDWTALAEIQIVSQTRNSGQVMGTFRVKHLYDQMEQKCLTGAFVRMYGG